MGSLVSFVPIRDPRCPVSTLQSGSPCGGIWQNKSAVMVFFISKGAEQFTDNKSVWIVREVFAGGVKHNL